MADKIPSFCNNLYLFLHILDTVMGVSFGHTTICLFPPFFCRCHAMATAPDPAPTSPLEIGSPARQEAFVRAELIRRLFDGSRQSRYFSFVLWPVIAAIYWRQIDLTELIPPFLAHVAVTIGFDVLRRNFTHANPPAPPALPSACWFPRPSFLS